MRCTGIATAVVIMLAAALALAGAEPSAPQPRPYKPVAIELPEPVADPSFAAFRKQVVEIAQRKDRAALAKLVAAKFFWITDDGKDIADPARSGFDNLARALYLDNSDEGWELLAAFAAEATADPVPDRAGVICGPGEPKYDGAAASELGQQTGTTSAHWYYPTSPNVDVRTGAAPTSAVIGKLGMHLIWAYPEESPAAAVFNDTVRVVLPSGQFGFIAADALAPLPADLLCYVKDGGNWRLAGYLGGLPPGK